MSEGSNIQTSFKLCECGCGETTSKRYIHGHNRKGKSNPNVPKGDKHVRWKGGRVQKRNGYIVIFRPNYSSSQKDGYILEHRYVMEQYLGRCLQPWEVVHHINGDRRDNRIENLQLFESVNEHTKFEETGKKRTEEHRRKISESLIKHFNKRLQTIGRKGKPLTEQTKQKISQFRKGKKLSDETKKKISLGVKNDWIRNRRKR